MDIMEEKAERDEREIYKHIERDIYMYTYIYIYIYIYIYMCVCVCRERENDLNTDIKSILPKNTKRMSEMERVCCT